jgi:phenylpropionate dioxygenase-like ring-hydroxylating dioxygenase large terminal subunit
MRQERQVQLLERVAAAGPHLEGLHAPASKTAPSSAYTDPQRFADEMRILFRPGPVLVGLSCELVGAGSYRAITVDGIPIVVVRQPDGSLRALVNACRHRGAPLVDTVSDGQGLRAFSCPYHAWTYELDGALRARPMSAGAFDDVTADCSLHPLPVAERYGLIFVRPTGTDPIDVDDALAGAQDDLDAFGLDRYVHIGSRVNTWKMNWKLFFDTFTESYHIRTLHRTTLAPTFNSDTVIFEPYGRNALSIGLRKDVLDETAKPREEWSLLPYGTIQYFLLPNTLLTHQLDHLEVWRVEPLDVGTVRTTTSVFAPTEPHSERARNYFVKNLDLLLQVTGTEDFPLMEQIQQNLASGALPEVVYGRNEPPLIHFHRSIEEALAAGRATDGHATNGHAQNVEV